MKRKFIQGGMNLEDLAPVGGAKHLHGFPLKAFLQPPWFGQRFKLLTAIPITEVFYRP